jgi:hypothetical protein
MGKLFKIAILSGALAASALVTVSPAEARVSTGVAVGAGLLGLGVGAAIASDRRDDYYAPPPPPPPPPAPVYYAPPPPPPPPPAYAYDYVQHCRVVNHWDGWAGRYVATRRCW